MRYFILSLLFAVSIASAQTNVSGQVSGTWTSAGNPYYVVDHCSVSTGNALTIQPGVEVYFRGDYGLIIEGNLNAQGTESDSLLFTVDPGFTDEFCGIRMAGGTGTISYARIEYADADGTLDADHTRGGGIYCETSTTTISHCVIKNCSSSGLGGAVGLNLSPNAVLEYCLIYNDSSRYGGGVYVNGTSTVRKNRIFSNKVSTMGGAIHCTGDESARFENNMIYDNYSETDGGGIGFASGNTSVVINNVFYNNSADRNGGAVFVNTETSNPVFTNNAIWNNSAAVESNQIHLVGSLDIDYSVIQGGTGGIGGTGTLNYGANNLSSNPLFNDAGNADFHIEANSPMVDAGTNTNAPTDDFEDNARPYDGDGDETATTDIGIYEYGNTPPVITSDPVLSVIEGGSYSYQVEVTDPDVGETQTYSLPVAPGFLSISAGGLITGLPGETDVDDHIVTVRVVDQANAIDTQTYTLSVIGINDPPVVSDIPNQTVDEGGTFTAIALDDFVDDSDNTDAEISWVASGNVELGVSINPATRVAVITIPNANWNGNETITFTASDTEPLSDADAAVFTVNSINDAPVVSNIPGQTIDEGATFTTINLDDYVDDVDHSDTQISWSTSGNTDLNVTINARIATITTPNNDWSGSETITFTATDPDDDSDNDDATFEVNSINDPPVVSDIPDQTISEGSIFTTINLDNYVSDVEHSDAQINWSYNGNSEISVSIVNRIATITVPDENWNGDETITFTATDPENGTDSDAADFEVIGINDPPVVTNIPNQSIAEGADFSTINLDDYVSDIDHTDSQINWSYSGNSELSVNISNRIATITTPDQNWNGSENITFTATDPLNGTDSDAATFEVSSINDPPIVSDIPDQSVTEGNSFTTINLDNYVADADHGDSEITWTYSGNSELTVSIVSRVATITIPDENWNGSELITFTATDPSNSSNSDEATFEVTGINDPPVVSDIPNQTIDEGSTFTTINLDNYVSDLDHGDAQITWSSGGETDLIVSIEDRVATISMPNEDWNGSEILTFTATDPQNGRDSDPVTFEVISINDPPVITDVPGQTILEGNSFSTFNLDNFVSDVDHLDSELDWEATGASELNVSINPASRVVVVNIPHSKWFGSETITFTATDPENGIASDTATFVVVDINEPPVISDIEPQIFSEDDSLVFSFSELGEYVEDPEQADSLLFFEFKGGKNITASIQFPLIVLKSPDNWFGRDTLEIVVSDGELADSTKIYFEVRSKNDTPFFTEEVPDTVNIFLMADEEMNIADYADDHDFDMPGDSLRWEVSVSDDTLKFDFDPETKDLTLTAPDYAGVFTVTITVTDDSGAVAEESFAVKAMVDPSAIENIEQGIPSSYVLKQNYPNPFNPSTHIKFGLPQAGDVLVEIYNLLGQKIVTLFDGYTSAGYHVVDFEASNLPSGMYFYRIQADKFNSVKKMMLIK